MNEERDWEAEARVQGWKPISEFNGPEDKWTDPRTFVEKGEKITGILKSRVDRLEQTAAELRMANKEFGEYQAQLRKSDREKAQARISELEAARAAAITEGDGATFTKIDKEIQTARETLNAPLPPIDYSDAQAEQEWVKANAWYGKDPALTAFADGVTGMVEAEGYAGKARLDEIARRTKETFPHKFQNPRKNGANAVDAGGEIETGDSKAKTYENLPPDAKAACDKFVANGLTTKKDYVTDYEWD